jgi:REP element-mobilizing transposase RayT
MKYNPEIHCRQSIRLQGYDYSNQCAYFVTICTWSRENILGNVLNSAMQLTSFGEIVMKCWEELPNHYKNIELDQFVIMPNHLHGIIWINGDIAGTGFKPAPTDKRHGLSEIVRALKTFSSRRINKNRNISGTPVWQRNYFDRIIRNEKELTAIREYIINNPLQWELDENNPVNW